MAHDPRTKAQLLEELAALQARLESFEAGTEAPNRESRAATETRDERLIAVLTAVNELSQLDSPDVLCRRAVELGCARLGFDRLGIWLAEPGGKIAVGTFGIDEEAQVRDERGTRITTGNVGRDIFTRRRPYALRHNAAIHDGAGNKVGDGDVICAPIWKGDQTTGFVNADNFLNRRPLTDADAQVLALYAAAVGHLLARASAEADLRHARAQLEERVAERTSELTEANQNLRHEIGYRHQAEARLKDSEQRARQFGSRLWALVQAGNEMSTARSIDDLCQMAVTIGRERLGFDRMSLWFLDKEAQCLRGSFGTDEQGGIRDERELTTPIPLIIQSALEMKEPPFPLVIDKSPLYDHARRVVGDGYKAVAVMWDGSQVLGVVHVDNLLSDRAITQQDGDILTLLSSTLGHLCSRQRTIKALHDSESLFRTAAESFLVGVYVFQDAGMRYVNPAFESIFGYPATEICNGMNVIDIVHPDDRPIAEENIRSRFAGEKDWVRYNFRAIRKDGEIIYCEAMGRVVEYEGRPAIFGTVLDMTERQRHLSQIRKLTVDTEKLLEEERARLSRHLHDEIGQAMTSMMMRLAWIRRRLNSAEPAVMEEMDEVHEQADQISSAARSLARSLRPPVLDREGLFAAVRTHLNDFQKTTGIACRTIAQPPDLVVEEPFATIVYRLIQEALTNVARHSKASRCDVSFMLFDNELEIRVNDDGVGADEEELAGHQSLGIAGMRERALALGGEVSVTNGHGGGVCVTARLPLPEPRRRPVP